MSNDFTITNTNTGEDYSSIDITKLSKKLWEENENDIDEIDLDKLFDFLMKRNNQKQIIYEHYYNNTLLFKKFVQYFKFKKELIFLEYSVLISTPEQRKALPSYNSLLSKAISNHFRKVKVKFKKDFSEFDLKKYYSIYLKEKIDEYFL